MPRKDRGVRIVLIILIWIIILLPIISFIMWYFHSSKQLKILILDKTVLTQRCQEHRSLNWLLTHYKYTKANDKLYRITPDYFGFFPLENKKFIVRDLERFDDAQLDSLANNLDAIYYTDTYGIYRNEWFLDTLQTEHSPKVYGGMTYKEYLLMEKMHKRKKLVLHEFNTIGSPTPSNVRISVEKLFHIRWSSWTARFFHSFDTIRNPELPKWLVRGYKEQHNGEWPFKRSGIAYVHEDGTIFVLEMITHLHSSVPYIYTIKEARKEYGLPDKVHYPFWFDVTYNTSDTNKVIAYFHIDPNEKGDSILKHFGLPATFPAVIQHTGDYPYYYFTGDFADNPVFYYTCYFQGIENFDFLFYNKSNLNERNKFFWKFYMPLMRKILDDYTSKK